MIVVVAGMYRSGSTFCFNIIREILQSRGSVITYSTDSLSDIDRSQDADHVLLKTHQPDEELTRLILEKAVTCVCTVRKPEDAIASWFRTFSFSLDDSTEIVRNWLTWHHGVASHVFNIHFDELNDHPFQTVRKIGGLICNDVSLFESFLLYRKYRKHRIKKIFDRLQKGDENVKAIDFSYYDQTTFFHRNHVTSMGNETALQSLGNEEIKIIREALRPFLDESGNYRIQS